MRRLYVAPLATLAQHRTRFSTHMTTYWLALSASNSAEDVAAWQAAGAHVVISTEFTNEAVQEAWEADTHVTVLPDPVFEGTEAIESAPTMVENAGNICKGHKWVCNATMFGAQGTDTIAQLHKRLQAWHPGYKLRTL